MIESQQVLEWIAEGLVKGKVETLLRILEVRFPPGAPPDLAQAIRATTDLDRLSHWLDLAITAASLDDFLQKANI
jgi:hypothetical protein